MKRGRKIRILHVLNSLEPGGMENGVVNVTNRLDESEFEVHICCLETGGAFVERLNHPENVHVLHKKAGFSKRAVWQLMRTISRVGADVIHPHNLAPLTYSVLATMLGFWKPVLQGEHGMFQGEQRNADRLRFRRRLYRFATRIHTVSEGLKQWLIEQGFDGRKIVPIINGVDIERFKPADKASVRREIGVPETGPWMGIVGRFDHNKHHLLLIDAFNLIGAEFPDARLLILGDNGNEKEKIIAACEASPFRDRLHRVGFQSNPLPYYQALDLLTAPSPMEGLSNAVLESMACGVPVLAHMACGNSEVITNGVDGHMAAVDTPEIMAEHMRRVLGDHEGLKQAGVAARQTIEKRFSIDGMVENYAQLYRELA
jgi:glycosyltransferase involved in cell wall biosynthesis